MDDSSDPEIVSHFAGGRRTLDLLAGSDKSGTG